MKEEEKVEAYALNAVLEVLLVNVARLQHQLHARSVGSRSEIHTFQRSIGVFFQTRWWLATWHLIFTTIDSLPSDHIFASNAVQPSHMHPG